MFKWFLNWTCDMALKRLFQGTTSYLWTLQLQIICESHEPMKFQDS